MAPGCPHPFGDPMTEPGHHRIVRADPGGGGSGPGCGPAAASSVVSSVGQKKKPRRPGSSARPTCADFPRRKPPQPGGCEGMEAAGVEPASTNGSSRASTCVAHWIVRTRAASEQPTPGLALKKSRHPREGTEERPARLFVASSPASGGPVRRRACVWLRGQCQISVGSCVFPGVFYEVPEVLGTLLRIRHTCRSRYAPFLESLRCPALEYTPFGPQSFMRRRRFPSPPRGSSRGFPSSPPGW